VLDFYTTSPKNYVAKMGIKEVCVLYPKMTSPVIPQAIIATD